MINFLQIIAFLSWIALVLSITGVGLNPIRPLQLNKGLSTKYMFYINPETSIASGGQVQITFPSEFDSTAIAAQLSCLANTTSTAWKSVPCTFSSGSVIVTLGTISNQQLNILVSQPTNPSIYSMSSYFSVCLMVASMTTSCSQTFGKVVFPNAPLTTTATPSFPSVTSLNTLVVGQSSTYQIQFSLGGNYTTGNTIRITFPPGYLTSSTPICQMNGTYNQVITTFVWPDQRSIECQSINKTLATGESLKIIGIFNPQFAGTFGNTVNGFKLEILQQTTTIVLEQIYIKNTVGIVAGSLTGYISQANNFINGDVVYTFYLNLLNSLTSSNFILISFDSSWTLYNSMCSVISGITLSSSSKLNCTNSTTTPGKTILNVTNFLSASVSNQLVFSTTVRSPATPGTYTVGISTANINGTVDSMTTTVFLNGTYGDYSMLSINAIVAQSDVPVSGTGPLELTFFLNYQLPQTNVLTYGKFVIKIYPQIPLPPPLINGVLKCYFFNTIPAQTCVWDTTTSASYTLLTINTPLTLNYQYSEIPITVTTEGAVNSSKIGITIADIVTRYRFELAAYQQNNSVIPTEVYFSEFIAAPIYLPITYYALTKEVNEKTHLRFQFTSPYNFTSPLSDDLRIKIEFLGGGAWASNLGYSANTIYKNFPCVYSDNKVQTLPPQYNSKISCDFYTYLTGPHASLTNSTYRGPYILVSGFTNKMYIGGQVRLELGGFLIGSSTNLAANIRFSLVQETPTMLTKYVELYYNEFTAFTTASQSTPNAGSGVLTDVIFNSQINAVSKHTIAYTAPSTFFAVIYQFDMISTPSFTNQFVECTIGTAPNINWCTMLGYPLNYIVEYSYSGSFAASGSSQLNFTNGVYAGTFSANARYFSSSSLTIYKQNFNVVYTPYTIATSGFYMDTGTVNYLYKGAETYFYVTHRPVANVPANGFIRLIFATDIQLGQNAFCSSSNIGAYVAEVGLVCTIESTTSLKISNINALSSSITYSIRVRLSTLLTSGSSVSPTVTIQDHYSITADPSIVNQVVNQALSPAQVNYYTIPNQFKMNNPRVAFQTPRVNYVGKFEFIFNPSSDVLVAYQIKVILNNHAWNGGYWTTPNGVISDPMVCMINYVRVPCTYTLSPLTVTMNVSPAGIVSNQNNIITLDTEYLIPYNGIVHPSQGGQYQIYLQFLTNSSTIIQQQSFYQRILPNRLRNFYVNSTVNDVGVENMFYVQVQIGSQTVNAYSNGATYSRIYIEFPTVDSNNNPLFANNLGGYAQTGDIVGCAFDTWTTNYIRSSGGRMMCRLIMSQVPGQPARVEVFNHGALSGSTIYLRMWIAKIYNPATAVTSVPISIKIDHVVASSNDIYELYYDTFDVFMNSQTPNPTYSQTLDCQSGYGCSSCSIFDNNINSRNFFRFAPVAMGGYSSSFGYYYVLDTTSVIKPRSLENQAGNNNCHGSYYNLCLAFPDINYIIVWGVGNYFVQMYVDVAGAISQYTTNLVAKVWIYQRYIGTHTIQLSPTCWNQLRGSLNSVSVATTSSQSYDLYYGKRKIEVIISFTTSQYLPATGSVIVVFPSSIPRIYPHCRSMTNLGSQLYAQGTAYNGEVGCLVQNTRQWVITGFNALSAGSTVKIVGKIDLPTSQSGWIGAGEILTVNNTDSSNIRSTGFIIDYFYSSTFGINVNNNPSQNADGQIVLEETLPLRVGYVGPLRFKFSLATSLSGPNGGIITVRVPTVSTLAQAGGFSYISSKKYVCQIIQVTTYEQTGCIITGITVDNNVTAFPNFMFTMVTSSTLAASTLYKMVITTHTGSQPQGLTFPTVPGTYKIDYNFDTTGSTGFAIHNHLYLQVYGTKFSYLQVTSFCTCPNKKNIIWIKLTPTTTIQTTQQLIIEVPTVAANGNILFANDLGTGVADGGSIPYDSLNGVFSQSFMTCRLFYGDQTNNKPGKIVCGQFSSTISSSQILFFAISIGNPGSFTGPQVSIPFFIYSQEQGTTYRSNFDVVQNAVFLRTDVYSTSDVGNIISQNQQLQTSGVYIDMITRNYWNIGQGDYYVILFNFPLRVNGLFSGACTYPGGSTYGDAYYHQNLWAIICAVTSTTIGIPGGGYVTRNLRISNFYTPFYYLSSGERVVTTYTYLFSSKITSIGYITDGYPNQGPKIASSPNLPTITFTPIHQVPTVYAGSRDDYTITFTYTSLASVDLSFIQLVAFIFPSSYDFTFPESDCVESPSSQVEIASCYIDTSQGVIWITPVIKSTYTSNMAISITTRNLAIRNPVSNINFNVNNFAVKYYSWQNISQPSLNPLSNNNYCFLYINNFPSSAITYSQNPSSYQISTFSYIKYPHQKYYQETPFSSLVHRAPFEMEFYPTVAFSTQSGSNYNMIKIIYPSSFTDNAMVKIRDLQVFRPICYLNNQRIKNCAIDTATNTMTMSFQFALSTGTKYHVKFSILDSRNADIDGFLASAAVSNFVLMYKPYGAGNWYYTQTDQFPTLYSLPTGAQAGPFRSIVAGTATFGHAVASNLNFLNLLLTFNRTDITGLVFEIPSIDKAGNALFTSTSQLTTTFMSQSNGGSYPCGNNGLNAGGNVNCLLLLGDYANAGVVTRIIMTGFTYQSQMNCRFAFINPPNTGVYFSVTVRAFGGTINSLNPYGNQYMGSWQFNQIFQIVSSPTVYSTSYTANYYNCPSQTPWRDNTIFYAFSRDQVITAGRTSIAAVTVYDSTSSLSDKSFCQATLGSTNSYDDMLQYTLVSGSSTTKYVYFIRTWQSDTNVSYTTSSGWGLSYLKCKFFTGLQLTGYFFFANNAIQVAANQFSSTYCAGTTGIASPISMYFSQNNMISDGSTTSLIHQIDLTPTLNALTNFAFRSGDAMVLAINYQTNPWGTISSCDLLGGITSTSLNQRAFCNVGSNLKVYIVNVAGFVTDPLRSVTTYNRIKIRIVSSGLTTTFNSNNFNFAVRLYANYDAYNQGYQPIFYQSNNVFTSVTNLCYYSNPSNCIISQSSSKIGTFLVQSLSDTFMRVAFSPTGTLNFGTNAGYSQHFVITFNSFNYGPNCAVSNVVAEFSSSSTPGSGTNNTLSFSTATCDYNHIYLVLSGSAFANYWGGVGASSSGSFVPGQYIILYITISPDPSARDLPTYHHEYVFVQGSYNYQYSGSYYAQTQGIVTMPTLSLASSATISTLSTNVGGTTELSFQLSSAAIAFGPQNTGYTLLAQFLTTSGWTGSNDPFASYTNTALLSDSIACKCISGSNPLTVSAASAIVDTVCSRRMPNGSFTNYAIWISTNVQQNQDLICFFPEFKVPASTSFSVQFKLVFGDVFPPQLSTVTTKYSSMYRVTSNTLSFGSSPTMSLTGFNTVTQTPNFYASATNIGSSYSGSYTLYGSWSSGLNSPYIYINFLSAGPIPINSFCSDLNVFSQCRVYTNLIYLVVAQLKSTSASSFTLSNSGSTLYYPPSQTSLSNYGVNIYVGVNQWQYSTTISRSQSNLTPLSTAGIFNVYSDKYGSSKASYQTNLFFSFNPSGQTLFNNFASGSQLIISWSGVTTTTSCQVWVQGDTSANLKCTPSTNSLVIISPFSDYTTSNNIIASIGLLNPSSLTTFYANLYSYYYSGSRYSLTISTQASYSTDTTYTSYSLVAKSTISVYPFHSRISTVANAPIRIRFVLPSGSIGQSSGRLVLTYSQIQYSSAHICYIIVYNSYMAMMQQTQRAIYKTYSCSSSGSTISVVPPYTLTLSSSTYYELLMMPLNINPTGCSTYGCATQSGYQQLNFDTVNFVAYSSYSTGIISQQVNKVYNYEGSSFIGLQQIYVLCTEPVISSLYLSININFTSSYNYPSHYLEITLFDLKLTAFSGYSIGSIFPCQLSSNFLSINSRQSPQCRVVQEDLLNTIVTIRIENIGYLSPQAYWVTLDDIILPTPSQSDNNNKFDIAIAYYGPNNVKYYNYFPEIFQIDNTNQTAPVTSSSYTFNNPALTGFGNPIVGQITFNWPFDSTSSGYESKVAINFNGGYSAVWSNINSVTFVDSAGTYQLLWVNTKLNKFVFLMPNKANAVSTTLNITSLNNPYPYQRELYNLNSTNIIINFYNNFYLANKQTFSQPAFSIFTMNPSLIFINQNYPCNTIDYYPSTNTFSPGSLNLLTLSVEFDQTVANIQARNLGNINIKFTSGVSYIRECRAMRNNTQYINTVQICQPYYDGLNWYVKLYDVANSQLSTGWWVQIFATFNSATLAYTSYALSSSNLVVEYQSSYTITMAGYNSSRTTPSILSWLNNKYVANFYETQFKFLQAISGQSTQYLKFRYTHPYSSSSVNDVYYIYLADNTANRAFTPKTSGTNVIGQFLPAMGAGDRDFSVGMFAECTLNNNGAIYYYACNLRIGGLTAGADYLIQLSEFNTATSSFNMPTSPGRQEVSFMYQYYPSVYNYQFFELVVVYSYCYFRFAQLLHTTTTVGDYETITINYTPYGSLSAFASNNEISLRLSVEARYHAQDGGITAIYTADSMTLLSGSQYSGVVSNTVSSSEIYNIQFSQYSVQLAPLRFTLAKQQAYVDNTAYYWIIPLLQNPSTAYVSLRYNLTLVNSPPGGYQYIFNHYESVNEYYTTTSTSNNFATSINNNLRAVQTVNNVDLAVNLGNYSISQWNTAIFKINNALPGLIQSIANPNDTSNYNYYYFGLINMIMAQKKSVNSIYTIGIGSASSAINYQSTFGLSWVKVFNNSNAPVSYNPYTLYYSTPPALTLTYLTNYASSSVTLVEGYQTQGSAAMYKVTFTTPIIPLSSEIRILFNNSFFTSNNNGSCRVNTNFAKSSNQADVLRCYRVSQGFRIAGFNAISASTSVSAYFMLKSTASVTASPIQVDIFGLYQDNTTRIALANVGTVTHTLGTVPTSLFRFQQTVSPYFFTNHNNMYYMLEGTFNLRLTSLVNGDYIYITEVGWSSSGGNRRMVIKQNSTSVTGWTQLFGYYVSSNYYRYAIPASYLMNQTINTNMQYIFRYTVYFTDPYYNGFVAAGPGVARYWITTQHTTTQEVGFYDFVTYPQPDPITINNRYTAAGRQTVLDLSWTSDVNIAAGSTLVVSFDTHNLLNQMFANDLQGAGTNGATYRYLDCRQWYNNALISNSRLVCLLNFGNNQTNPPTPANLSISFTKACNGYSSSIGIRILIANVMNPTTSNLNTGVSLNVLTACESQQNQPCSAYGARGYYVTSSGTENSLNTTTSFSSSSSNVLATGLTHTFKFILTASIGTSDAIYIVYPENFQGVMPSNCAVTNYYCYVFPTRRWVVLYPTTTIGSSGSQITLSITSMNNPYYSQPFSQYFLVTVARSASSIAGDTYKILQSPFTPVSYAFSSTGTATAITITPTQTPSMYLRNYANTVYFTISNLFSDSRIQAIYILAPSDVTSWDSTYCNASITGTANFNYPLRFTCTVDPLTPQYLRLTLDSDMSTYNSAWALMSIRVHAKFTIADFPTAPTLYVTPASTSGSFYAYSSMNATSSSSLYYMSQCSLTISISQNQVPIISVINFNTKSFADRQARVNNKQVFYMLFKPLVNVNIGSIVFTIPSQFNYPGVFSFDNCLMIGRTTVSQPSCQLSRSQGQTLVTIVPTNYDNQVKIIQIGTVSQTNWFTAPSLPGDFYNMNVAIYSTSGTLIAKQTRKISAVYGQAFDIPSMSIQNVQDASTKLAVYDLTFVTGTLQIPPGTLTTATTQTSQLQFTFENFNGMNATNVFSNDLGTGLSSGDQIGCKFFTGLTAVSGMRLKCLLYKGTNSTNKPMIRVINYNFIDPQTTITIGFSGIQTLPAVLVNTISVSVVIYYTDISSSTYLYTPTSIVTVPTQSTNMFNAQPVSWVNSWSVSATYSGTNIVLQPTTFTITYTVPYWYNALYYTYSSTGANDQFILMTFYPPTLLDKNNPTSVSCSASSCTGVDVYYASGTVRFRHATSTGGSGTRSFTFTNFPTSAYTMLNQPVYVYFQIFQSYQAVYQKNITVGLNRTVEKCTKFNFGVVSVSSLNGGQIGVTYLFSIKTNHFVPANGALSITIPTVYGNLLTNAATCTLIGFTSTTCYCSILTPSRVDIYANGTELSSSTTYSIQITGMQNPNVQSSNFVFIVTSYYASNIYLGLKICENQIVPPSINVKPLRSCTLSWTPQYYNQNFNTVYVFQLSCSDVFRGDSTLYISLPSAYSAGNKLGNYSCSSYESTTLTSPVCTLQNINGAFTLTTSIDASSQSSLSLILNLVNPINNTYMASAYVTSKGTQYASSSNSSITILSNSYASALSSDVSLLNLPKEAGLMSTYVFKISPISNFTPSNLGITFPSNFYIDSTKVTISIFNHAQNNIFSLLTYNNIQSLISNASTIAGVRISSYPSFTVTGTSIYLTNITGQVSSSLWTYVFVSNIQNPSAYVYANFTVAYYLISNGFQALQWAFQNPLTYYISSPPEYISINSVTVTDYDLLYPANYTFNISGSNGSSIGIIGKNISYIIVIPTFYKNTLWANSNPVCQFAGLNRTSSCYIYQSEIIVTEIFTSNFTSLSLTISTLLNPSLPTSCDTTDTSILAETFFIIRIIDTVSNSFLFESSSVVDSKNCIKFWAIRIPISLQYSLIMTAGLAYNITYGLTKPSSNLKITAYISNTAFSFSPATVDFNDYYSLTKSTQLFLRSDVSAGTYVIYFNKSESSNQTEFRNILPVTITVSSSNTSSLVSTPTISIPSMSDSTIGYSVIIPIKFSLPSSTEMTLFMTISEESNQTLAQYSSSLSNFSITPRIFNILPQQTLYNYTVTQTSQIVPPPLTLNFKLTSNYPIVHNLTTPTMYLCFDRDPKYNVLYPPLRVTVTQFLTSCNSQDIGKTVTNIFISNDSSQSSAASVVPKIINMAISSVASTGAVVTINSISAGTIYYACISAGYSAITNATLLISMNNSQGVTGYTQSVALNIRSGKTAQINFVATATISNLSQSSNYVLYAVSQSNLGTSPITSIRFSTTGISKGVQFRMSFTSIVTNLVLVNALVQSLRVSPGRIKILTSLATLQQQANASLTYNNKPKFIYDIVLAPDQSNDIVAPITTIKNFANSSTALSNFQSIVSAFDISTFITYFQLRPVEPQLKALPVTNKINNYNASFNLSFKAQANVYSVLIEKVGAANNTLLVSNAQINPVTVSSLTAAEQSVAPSSSQIKAGTDYQNNPLGKYKVVQITTDENGKGQLVFEDLKEQSAYVVYFTASSPLPYQPTMLWPDSKVITFSFYTLPNPNVGDSSKQLEYLEQLSYIDKRMAEAMKTFVKAQQIKKDTQNKK